MNGTPGSNAMTATGDGATMDGMPPDTPAHARRRWHWKTGRGDAAWFWVNASLTTAVAACGFALSFTNLGGGARADAIHPWWLLPVSIDAPIPVFVVADHYLVSRGYRSLFARACAWAFAVLTVALNVAPPSSWLWHDARGAAPAVWVLGIEAVRRMWRAHRLGARPATDRAPLAEWVADFRATRRLWRRKLALGIGSWTGMRHMEEARLLVADLAAAREDAGQPVPAAVTRTVTTGWLPADLVDLVTTRAATEWEPAVTGWVARQVALPRTLLAAVTGAAPKAERQVRATSGPRSRKSGRRQAVARKQPTGPVDLEGLPLDTEARILALVGQGHSPSKAGILAGKSDSYGRKVVREAERLGTAAQVEPSADDRARGVPVTGEA